MLEKLSRAIKAEYAPPYPSRETALKHFRERYHVEKRGGIWYVDRSIRRSPATGSSIADAILRRVNSR